MWLPLGPRREAKMLRHSTGLFNAIVLAGLLGLATPGLAAPPEGKGGGKGGGDETDCGTGLHSPVILAVESVIINTANEEFPPDSIRNVQMRPDGSCRREVAFKGNLTHKGGLQNGVWVPRYFLMSEPLLEDGIPVTLPDGSQYFDFVVYEEGVLTTRKVLTSDRSLRRSKRPWERSWSIDGDKVLYVGARYELDPSDPAFGQVIDAGLFVGDVVRDENGAPVRVENERLVVSAGPHTSYFAYLSWSWSGDRIAYRETEDATTGYESAVYVADVSRTDPYTEPPALQFAGGGKIFSLVFSPVDDDRLAVERQNESSCGYIEVVDVPDPYNGELLSGQQIMNSKNARNTCYFWTLNWSPDGQYFAFYTWSINSFGDIYTIRSDGSSKAVNITHSKDYSYSSIFGWRD